MIARLSALTLLAFSCGAWAANPRDPDEYSGNYTQEGRMGRITGSFTCTGTDSEASPSGGESGTFTLDEVEVSPRGLMARYSARINATGCMVFGNFSGARATVD